MSDLVDDFGDPDRSSRAGWLARVAHWLPWVAPVYVVWSALQWVEVVQLELWPWYLRVFGSVPFVIVFIGAILHQSFARLCVRCMEAVPADAPVRAQKKLRWLRFEHWCLRLRGAMPLAVIMLYSVFTVAVLAIFDVPLGGWTWIYAPLDLFTAAVCWSFWVHHQYRPWCPYCKPWDGGGGMREPSPDPTGSGTKVSS